MNRLISIFIFLFFNILYGQNSAFDSLAKTKESTSKKIKVLDSLIVQNHYDFALSFKYANWLAKNKKYDELIKVRKNIAKYLPKDSLKLYNKNLLYLGYYLQLNNKNREAISIFNTILKNEVSNITILKNDLESLTYNEIGKVYQKIHDNSKALMYYKLALSQLNKQLIKNKLYLNICLRIASIYVNKKGVKNYKNGIYYCELAADIYKKSSFSYIREFEINDFLATFYNKNDFLDIEKSLFYYNKALKIAKKNNDENKEMQVLLWLGNLYNTTDYQRSIHYLDQAIEKCLKSNTDALRQIHYFYGLTYARFNNFDESLKSFHKSFKLLINHDLIDIAHFDRNSLINSTNKILLIEMLPMLAEVYLLQYKSNNDIRLLKKSIQYFKLVDEVIDLLKINSSEFKSRLFWRKLSASIYSKAIKACYLNNNLKDALYFVEKNKALLLMEDMATHNYQISLDIPKSLLEKEIKYKKKRIILNQKKTKNQDSLLKAKLKLDRILSSYQDSIYKGKNKFMNSPKILTIGEIQKTLNKGEVFIEYHISKDNGFGIYNNNENGYVVFLTKEKSYFVEITQMSDFKNTLKSFVKLLKKPLETKIELENFTKNAYLIFDKLFPTEEIKNLIQHKKLTIVPDDILSFLPFETLITTKNTMNFLVYKTEVSYSYSKSFQQANNLHKRHPKKDFLGFAPVQFKYDSLVDLPNSKNEILTIDKIFKGNYYIDKNATKQNFIAQSNEYNIIHLATHADANNEQSPWIAFKNKKLKLAELYTTNTQANLVVLSACNTSLGKIETGEGVMSLVRGFFYNGTNTVVSSLWNINDKTSSELMIDFYKNLKKGATKSSALHNAKISYLKNHSDIEASPYYWSSFILIGDTAMLENIHSNYNYYIIGIIFILISMLLWKLRNNFSSNKR